MASVIGTFVPTYQGLSAADLVRPARPSRAACYPFDAAGRLPFFRARNAIYHLCRALLEREPALTVLAPDYNSGNEILAMRAAGARLRYYPIDRRMQLDPEEVERLCVQHAPHVLYVIHYVGWPQPMPALVDLCRRRGMLLVEDCALSLLSATDGGPLGSFGDWSVFCLYKTLPLPNGALLVQNGARLEALERLALRQAGAASVLGRTAELLVQRLRGRASRSGAALLAVKRGMGRAAAALDVRRANVGDIGFALDEVDLAMSPVSARLLERLDHAAIRRARVANYRSLDAQLDPAVPRVFPDLPDGVCPLFFPILVDDKPAAARALQRRGVDALEFWNESSESGAEMSDDARFLRAHVLELPIHQDLTPRQLSHMARQVSDTCRGHRTARPAATRSLTVERIEGEPAFTRLEPEWNDLLQASSANTPFLAWEWIRPWWRHLSGGAGLQVFCVRSGGRLVAAAPLVVRREPPVWLPRLEFLGSGDAGSDYLDLVVRRGAEPEAIPALDTALQENPHALRLDHVRADSHAAHLAGRLAERGWRSIPAAGGVCPMIPLTGHTWDSYLSSLGSNHRANVRRRARALERGFRVDFTPVVTDTERREALGALAAFHDRRFTGSRGSTAFRTPALRAFHDEATRGALERGWLRMYTLRLDGAIAAVMYGLLYDGRFHFYQHGFDHRYDRYSIGLVLMARTIEAAIAEGAHTFDLLWGDEPYKRLWARETTELRQFHLFPDRLGGRVQHGVLTARRAAGRIRRTVAAAPHA